MKRILVPVDGSESALHAVRHVVRQRFIEPDVEVHLVHAAVPLSSYVARFIDAKTRTEFHAQRAKDAVARARSLLEQNFVPHTVHIRFGDPVATILCVAREFRSSQIIMGTARKNLLVRLIQDSVSARVTEQSEVPVQLVTGKSASFWERIGVPAVVSAAFAALIMAAAD